VNGRKNPPREPRDEPPRPETSAEEAAPSSERFADLVGDAKRLQPGPARIPRRAAPPRPRRALRAPHEASKPLEAPSFRWPEPENRHLAAAPGINDQQLTRLRRGEPEPEERIDLHGTRLAEAKPLLAKRIASACARELRCLVVVHGVGKRSPTPEAVLRDAVPDWLTRGAVALHVLAFAPAPRRHGGDGATLVLLRKAERAKSPE
jgi:DNA-nicking Smr family endonuclease